MRTSRRSRRVIVLIVGIVLLSLADLAMTAAHLRSTGMIEANPIAAFVLRGTQSLAALSLYKAATVGLCVILLYHLRRSFQGELAAWTAAAILVLLSVHWHQYTDEISGIHGLQIVKHGAASEQWIRLE